MEFENWKPKYKEILNDFDFDPAEDEGAAEFLSSLLAKLENKFQKVTEDDIERLIKDKTVYVFGEGPTLTEDLTDFHETGTVIAADGATSALLKVGIVPEIIVSDLDGNVEDQVKAVEQGAVILIHAHGDNKPKLERWVPEFSGRVMGTSQSEPPDNLYNFGGFTDGDRSVFLADHFMADAINLVAFDFLEPGDGADKSSEELKLKIRKLTWANLLIGILANPRIDFVTPKGQKREILL